MPSGAAMARKNRQPSSLADEDSVDSTSASLSASSMINTGAPRATGSMVNSSSDDTATRIRNIEMIELGAHRIQPWYFSPYPQVCILYNYVGTRDVPGPRTRTDTRGKVPAHEPGPRPWHIPSMFCYC